MQNQRIRLYSVIRLDRSGRAQNHWRPFAQNHVGSFLIALKLRERPRNDLRPGSLPVRCIDAGKALIENVQDRFDMLDVPDRINHQRAFLLCFRIKILRQLFEARIGIGATLCPCDTSAQRH